MGALVNWLNSVPLFPILLGAGVVFSAVLARSVGRILDLPWWIALGLGVSVSLVVAATLSPAPSGVWGPCMRSMVLPIDPRDLVSRSDRALNTWLFVPLGFFAGFAAVKKVWVLVLAFGLPFVVEGLQRFVTVLDRRCQFQDLVDNTWGLILGAMVGIVVGFAAEASQSTPRD